jgi:hypothetical protein
MDQPVIKTDSGVLDAALKQAFVNPTLAENTDEGPSITAAPNIDPNIILLCIQPVTHIMDAMPPQSCFWIIPTLTLIARCK